MVKIISIANRKGGVGKTTTAVNIATAMAAIGKRVLILDMDPQGNATTSLGINKNKCLFSTYDIMINNCKAEDAIVKTDIKNSAMADTPSCSSFFSFWRHWLQLKLSLLMLINESMS